ncbi:MAG: 3-phosphoserine/phosphohydroxythreonine transaminase [Pseudomonadota bacterium]
MSRSILNFGAGPAMLPKAIMRQAQSEFLDWNGTGKSVMEIGHRTDEFMTIAEHAEQSLREILNIPEDFHVLFLSGGATQHFSVIPMNLLQGKTSADYCHTGIWSDKAMQLAKRYCEINIVCSAKKSDFSSIPDSDEWNLDQEAAYFYYTDNETIGGLEFSFVPEIGTVPIVTDMTSSFLSKKIDINKFGIIFAAAQKNIGPAGMTILIVKKSILGETHNFTPDLFDYRIQAKEKSMINTPPTFNWYMAGLMFDWVKQQGGVSELERRNQIKSSILYDYIDKSTFYRNNITHSCRSKMNVVFSLADENLNDEFLNQAESHGLHALKGHRLAGGMRASLYNAMPESGVRQLVDFMQDFEHTRN